MHDDCFGPLTWSNPQWWETTVSLPPFQGCGRSLYDDHDEVGHAVVVRVETLVRKRRPSKAQRAAWRAMRDAGDPLWEAVLAELFRAYRRQRPTRERFWRACYGDEGLLERMPPAARADELRNLIAPLFFRVSDDADGGRVRVALYLRCAWLPLLVEVVVNDGRLAGVSMLRSEIDDSAFMQDDAGGRLAGTPFGDLVRSGPDRWWQGVMRCRRFSRFARTADERAAFRRTGLPRSGSAPCSTLPWLFAEGRHPVRVHAEPGAEPADRHGLAFADFARDVEAHAGDVMDAVFDYYASERPALRRALEAAAEGDPEGELGGPIVADAAELLPEVRRVDGLRGLVQLHVVNVFDLADGRPCVAFDFTGTWGGGGVGVRWRDGRVWAVGTDRLSLPDA